MNIYSLYQNYIITNKKVNPIPKEYTKVDYIQSYGGQYINTGYYLQTHDKVKIKFIITGYSSSFDSLFGAREQNYANHCYAVFNRFASASRFTYARTGDEHQGIENTTNILYTIETLDEICTITNHSDGTTSTITNYGAIQDCVNPCGIFTLNTSVANNFSPDIPSKIKLYSFEIYNSNNELTCNCVPVLNTLTNKYGVYETITQQFIGNIGSGDFTGGNN